MVQGFGLEVDANERLMKKYKFSSGAENPSIKYCEGGQRSKAKLTP
jgi:hypothetical protein